MNALAHRRRKLFALYQMMMALGQIEAPTKWDSFHRKHAFDTRYRNHAFDVFGRPSEEPPALPYKVTLNYKFFVAGGDATYYPSTKAFYTGSSYLFGQRYSASKYYTYRGMFYYTGLPAGAITEAKLVFTGGGLSVVACGTVETHETYPISPIISSSAWTFTDRGTIGTLASSAWNRGPGPGYPYNAQTALDVTNIIGGGDFWVVCASTNDFSGVAPTASEVVTKYTFVAYLYVNGYVP
jgi:hypothetical protein